MQLRDELMELTNEYTDDEIIYKIFYDVKNNPKQLYEFINSQNPEFQASIENWIRAERGEVLKEFTENTLEFNFVNNIVVSRHSRYCPFFLHKHTFFEIIVIVSGSCINYIEGKEYVLSEGDICIVAPGEYHALKDSKDSVIYNILLKHYNFSETFNSFLLQNNVLSSFFMQSLYSDVYNKFITFHTKGDEHLEIVLYLLIYEYVKNPDLQSPILSELHMNTVFNYLALKHVNSEDYNIFINTDSQFILKIKQYITENMCSSSLTTLACEFNYSPTYLSKLVHRLAGTNISNIIRRVRIDKACSLLSNTDISISEIGEIIGYNSTRQFNRAFYTLINKTPTEYRQRIKSFVI